MLISDAQLIQLLVKRGIITEKAMRDIQDYAKNTNLSLVEALVEKDIVTDENLGLLIADSLKLPFIVLTKTVIPEEVFHIIPERIARIHKVIVFARDKSGIKLAMADPRNTLIQAMISQKTGEKVNVYFATEKDITNTFYIFRRDLQKAFNSLIQDYGVSETSVADAPVAKLVDLIIDYAYQDKASDVHIEPEETGSLVRFRIDGVLQDVLHYQKNLHDQIVTRIKVVSRLRTDEHMSAQDGKMRIKLLEETIDIRVSILPISEGEKVVLRLLSSHSRQYSLVDLGMNPEDLKKVTAAFNKSYGMVLSTGPTGSGKTTSIYSILKILNTRDKNITTVEDPVEYRIQGVNQIQVNVKTNLTFANGLRSILRQDPNIIFVGEIRDDETAGIAVNAALTGHLVLSTLHTNDAATSLPRLIDMGVEPFLVASTVNIIIGQRLIRKTCEMCKTSISLTQSDLNKNFPPEHVAKYFTKKEIRVYQGKGCKVCHMTGYSGRIGIFEVLTVSNEIRRLITEKKDADIILKQAVQDGMTTMLDDGLSKISKGLTTMEEVLRVTKVESV